MVRAHLGPLFDLLVLILRLFNEKFKIIYSLGMSYYFNFAPLIKIDMQRKITLLLIVVLLGGISAFAYQGGPPSPGSPPGLPVPIDGFVSVFLAAGAVVGVRSLKSKKK